MRHLVFVVLLLCCCRLLGQEYVVALKHWDVKDGLSHRHVNCVFQARDGMIWLGTRTGLSRFDGYKFTNYTRGSNGRAIPEIREIAQDQHNNLWLVDIDQKVIGAFDPNSGAMLPIEAVTGCKVPAALTICTMADGSVAIASDDHTFYSWSAGKGMHGFTMPYQYTFISFVPARNWLVTESPQGLLTALDMAGHVVKTVKPPFTHGLRSLYFGTGGMYIQDTLWQNAYLVSPDLEITDLRGLLPKRDKDRSDNIFGAGPDGLIWWQEQLVKPGIAATVVHDFHGDKSLAYGEYARYVITDNKGNIWIANAMGLNKLSVHKNKFRQYYISDSGAINQNACRGISVQGGKLYISSEFSGAYAITMADHSVRRLTTSAGYALQQVSDGILTGDICLLNDKAGPRCFEIANTYVMHCWSIFESGPQQYLLGMTQGLLNFDLRSGKASPFLFYGKFPELAHSLILHIAPDRAGNIWICSGSGLYIYDRNKGICTRYSSADTGAYYLPAKQFQHFSQDGAGVLWLSTTEGLLKWDRSRNRQQLYTEADGLSNNNIYATYSDDNSNLWMSSDYGIILMNKATAKFTTYTVEDGITNNEFNKISHYKDSAGNIYFGSLNGITAFDPHDFTGRNSNEAGGPLVVTSFMQFNGKTNTLEDKKASLARDNTITMYPDDRFFTLEFALLNYDNPERTSYYWKIDDVDTGWNMQKDRTLRFSRLPYDIHTLRIRAHAADGSPGDNELTIRINVVRPYYLRTWFLLSMVCSVIALIIVGYRWRLYLLRRENVRLDKLVQEKTEDLRSSLRQKEVMLKEIHHRVKNNLQVISSLLRLQSHSVKDEAAKNALLEGQNRVLSIALVHQKLYQDEQIEVVELSAFTSELFGQLSKVFAGEHISFHNDLPETYFNINTAVPLGLMLNELITNSFKYAFSNTSQPGIWVSLEHTDTTYILSYADNGTGLPDEVDPLKVKSLGLSLVKMLSRQLHGNVQYSRGEKSTFIISFEKL